MIESDERGQKLWKVTTTDEICAPNGDKWSKVLKVTKLMKIKYKCVKCWGLEHLNLPLILDWNDGVLGLFCAHCLC